LSCWCGLGGCASPIVLSIHTNRVEGTPPMRSLKITFRSPLLSNVAASRGAKHTFYSVRLWSGARHRRLNGRSHTHVRSRNLEQRYGLPLLARRDEDRRLPGIQRRSTRRENQ